MIDISRGFKQVSLPDDFAQSLEKIEKYYHLPSRYLNHNLKK
jgi:hypothetical protein